MKRLLTLLLPLALLAAPQSAEAGEWETFSAKRYGFSMLVPKGTDVTGSSTPEGWGVLSASFKGAKLYGFAQVGVRHSFEAIEAFGVKATGLPAEMWTATGKDRRGLFLFNTVEAEKDGKLLFGMYGVSPRGSYALVLVTTPEEFKANRADYTKWYASVTVDEGWLTYESKRFGISMLIPKGAEVLENSEGEWGTLAAKARRVKLRALAKLGTKASAKDIEAVGVEATGIAAENWTHTAEGKGRGWDWYKSVVATDETGKYFVGGYGVGPKGSYLLLIETDKSEYAKHKDAFDSWYESVWLK